jgi:hypothetical protein
MNRKNTEMPNRPFDETNYAPPYSDDNHLETVGQHDHHTVIMGSVSVIGLAVYLYGAATSQIILIGIGCAAFLAVVTLKIAKRQRSDESGSPLSENALSPPD